MVAQSKVDCSSRPPPREWHVARVEIFRPVVGMLVVDDCRELTSFGVELKWIRRQVMINGRVPFWREPPYPHGFVGCFLVVASGLVSS